MTTFYKSLLVSLCLGFVATSVFAQQTTIKIATIAPESSSWMKDMRAGAEAIENATEGRVKFKFYGGGVQGNDKQVQRKMRTGQLHGGAFTSGGLNRFHPDGDLFALPMLFRTIDEARYVRNALEGEIRQRFEDVQAHFEYVSITGATVRPDRPGSVAQLSAFGSVSSAQTDDTFLIGAVQLPHLKTVDSMSCVVADRDDTAYIQVLLLRAPVTDFTGNGNSEIVASAGTGRPAVGEAPVTLEMRVRDEFSVIDNRLYQYYMRVDMLDVPQPPNSRLMFHGCTVKMAKDPA